MSDTNDEPLWRRVVKTVRKEIASALGIGKAKPLKAETLRDLTPNKRIKAVREILEVSDSYKRAELMASIAGDLGYLKRPKDRASIIDEATRMLEAEGESGALAASVIVAAREQLTPKHQIKLQKIVTARPELYNLIHGQVNESAMLDQMRRFNEEALQEDPRRSSLKNSVRDRADRSR